MATPSRSALRPVGTPTGVAGPVGDPRRAAVLTAAGVLLVALNLRLSISSTSALLDRAQTRLGFGDTLAALVPTLPLLVFAAAGAFSAALARRIGTDRAVLVALATLTLGVGVRAIPGTAVLLVGIVLGCAGIAVCNVLLPAVVRAYFPTRIPLVTGLYSTTLALGSATAAATAVPVADALGGTMVGLAAWAVPAVLALAVWAARRQTWRPAPVAAPADAPRPAVSMRAIARSRFGVLVTVFFGLQALNAYALMGWLPGILTDAGHSDGEAGALLGIGLVVGVPTTFVLMPLTATAARLRVAFVVVGTALVVGYVGLLVAPGPFAAAVAWALLAGVGLGSFPLILAIIGRSGGSAEEAAALSTFAQSAGYLMAAIGPFGLRLLRSATDNWDAALVALIAIGLVQIAVGLALTAKSVTGRD
ncbi:MFS transporter [Yinghuangia seranimata]|uniref:MFS transporter n=1 Tax=Yinghuangia seranimata TaxID=408067 RepID=UPI00248C629F|nr:MFS transporter [Yinghuangia seranimata]MDI2125574.1 MFS transporter [Yinghuangia seranimata]